MTMPRAKTTFVKPLWESNDVGNIHQNLKSSAYSYKEIDDFSENHGKQYESDKCLDENKRKHILKMDSVYSKLLAEFEEIQKWKALIEIEDKQKKKKIEELRHTIETQRKAVLDLQLQNENLNLQLTEEVQQRSFVSEKLHSTKEMCSALKKHFNVLQGQFEYRNRIEDMINAADNKKLKEIEDMRNKIDKISIEHSEKVEYLNNALASETNKILDLREKFEQQLSEVENEREALCTMIRNYEKEVGNVSALLDEEKNKTRSLEKEKKDLETNIFQLESSRDYYSTLLKEKEEAFKIIELSKQDIEKQLLYECSLVKEWESKYKELLHSSEVVQSESELNISSLKRANEQLNNRIFELEERFEEKENKNRELTCSLQDMEKKKCNLELKIVEEESKLTMYENLKNYSKELEESYSILLKEKNVMVERLKEINKDLKECKSENESLNNQWVEEAEKFSKCKKEYEKELAFQASKLSSIENNYELLLTKLKNTEGNLAESIRVISETEKKLHDLESLNIENDKVRDLLQKENLEVKEKLKLEEQKLKDCSNCEQLKEKIEEIKTLRSDLLKKEEDISCQSKGIDDLLKLLQDTEATYNKDRLAKQSEIFNFQDQIKSLEHELRMTKFEQKELASLKMENEKLNANVEELNAKITSYITKEKELQKKLKETELKINKKEKDFKKKLEEMELKNKLKEELENEINVNNLNAKRLESLESETKIVAGKSTRKKKNEKQEKKKENIIKPKISVSSKTHQTKQEKYEEKSDIKLNNSKLIDLEQSENLNNSDQESTASEYIRIEELQTVQKNTSIEQNNKKWDVDSSSSECLELVFDKKSEKAVGLAKATSKFDLQKNTNESSFEQKPFSFITKRKKNNQVFTQEDIVRKKFGLPPRKKQLTQNTFEDFVSVQNQQLKTPEKNNKLTMEGNVRKEKYESPWSKRSQQSTPSMPNQRKFFKSPIEHRDVNFKRPEGRKPWF